MAVLALIAVTAVGCNSNTKDNNTAGKTEGVEKTLIVRASGDPMSFNPDTLSDDNNYSIVQNIYNRLVKLDASKQIIPDLATEWDVSEDGKAITFHLRDDAHWHDGEPVTSKDVKYTFDTIKENQLII